MIYRNAPDASAISRHSVEIEHVFGATNSKAAPADTGTSVAVTRKRRRTIELTVATEAPRPEALPATDAAGRPSRVFNIGQSAQPVPGDSLHIGAGAPALANALPGAAQAPKRLTRPRRKHDFRMPGEVTRVVFEVPPRPAGHDDSAASPGAGALAYGMNSEHEQIVQALERVRATMRQASEARSFRIA